MIENINEEIMIKINLNYLEMLSYEFDKLGVVAYARTILMLQSAPEQKVLLNDTNLGRLAEKLRVSSDTLLDVYDYATEELGIFNQKLYRKNILKFN